MSRFVGWQLPPRRGQGLRCPWGWAKIPTSLDRGHMDGVLRIVTAASAAKMAATQETSMVWRSLSEQRTEMHWDILDLAVEQESVCCFLFLLVFKFSLSTPVVGLGCNGDWSVRWRASLACGAEERCILRSSEYWDTVRWVLWLVTIRKLELGWNKPVAFWGRVELEAPTSASHSTFCCVAWERTDYTNCTFGNQQMETIDDPSKKLFQRSMALIASLLLEFLKPPPARCLGAVLQGFLVFLHLHRFHWCVAISLAGLVKDSSRKNI